MAYKLPKDEVWQCMNCKWVPANPRRANEEMFHLRKIIQGFRKQSGALEALDRRRLLRRVQF